MFLSERFTKVWCRLAATRGFLKVRGGGYTSHENPVRSVSLRSFRRPWMGGNLRAALAPTLQLQYPREYNMCNTSLWSGAGRTRAQGLKIKHWGAMQTEDWSDLQHGMQTLKLFSLGLRLMMMLKVSYGSSVPLWILLVMSCWYWFGSSHTRNVLVSPRSLGFGSGPKPERWGECLLQNNYMTVMTTVCESHF